jgi:orotidine-5'-phosphate decarboxylase
MFGQRLLDSVLHKGTPAVIGLDPRLQALPDVLRADLPAGDWLRLAEAVRQFCHGVIDVVAELVPAVKPQAAFFEALGPPGWQALQDIMHYARSKSVLVLLDGKRNDISSTAEGYADAYLNGRQSPLPADALTVNPYLGEDGLRPFLQRTTDNATGIFVLVRTSNPGSRQFQELLAEGRPVYRHVAEMVEQLSVEYAPDARYGPAGAVVGATFPEQLRELREVMPHCWFLVPGYGSQGAGAADVAGAFHGDGTGAFVNSARAILNAPSNKKYRARYGPGDWQRAIEEATREMIAELRDRTPAGRL